MNWDTTTIAGGIPLGAFVSIVLSFLKNQFGLESEQARSIVAFAGLIYAVLVGIASGLSQDVPSLEAWLGVVGNSLASGVALIFGSEGFYQWVTKLEKGE